MLSQRIAPGRLPQLQRPRGAGRHSHISTAAASAGSISIVSLGPGSARLLTLEAREALLAAPTVYARTDTHPTLAELGPELAARLRSFDALYESATYAPYAAIATELLGRASTGEEVVYAVPGDACVAERTVVLLRAAAAAAQLPFRVLPGVSCLEPTLAAVGVDLLPSLWTGDALEVCGLGHPSFSGSQPALLLQLHSRAVASELKLTLMGGYAPTHRVCLVHAAGDSAGGPGAAEWVELHELDRSVRFGARTSLYIPARAEGASFEAVLGGVARARDALAGPWANDDPSYESEIGRLTRAAEAAASAKTPEQRRGAMAELLLAVAVQAHVAADEGEWEVAELLEEAAGRAAEMAGKGAGWAAGAQQRGYTLEEEEEEE